MSTGNFRNNIISWLRKTGRRLRRPEHAFLVIVACLIGLGGGFAAILFRYLIEGATWMFSGGHTITASGFSTLPWWWLLLMPAAGGLIVGCLVTWLAPEVKGSGVPEVMVAVALRGGHVRKRVGLAKALAVAACLGSGGAAGREGPIVHVGASIGSLIGSLLRVPVSQLRTFVGCGTAAGIAATFNAPIAGAMFAGEVILGQLGVVSFSAIVISSVVATVLSRHFIGDFPAFLVPAFNLNHTYELLFYAALGVLAGLVGCLFIKTLQWIEELFEHIPVHAILKPALGGLAVGGIGILLPQVLGVGYGAINDAMHTSVPLLLMLGLLCGKLLATSFTLSSGGSGGIFAPSLFLGAMLGGLGGAGLAEILPGQVGSGGSYALVTMGAMVSATTRAPITAIIIIFELTNNYTIILPLMVACILATLVAGQIVKPSIYHARLLRRGIDLNTEHDINILRNVSVGTVHMKPSLSVQEDASLEEILEMAIEHGDRHYVVVNRLGHYIGLIHLDELRYSFFNEQELAHLIVAADLVHRDLPTLLPSDNLDLALKLLGNSGLDTLPVLDPTDPTRVEGIITRDAVIDTYNQELLNRDMAGETARLVVAVERSRSVDLGDETLLVEIEAPPQFVGRTLKELELRQRFDMQVMLVKRREDDKGLTRMKREMPGPDFEIRKNDLILLLGSAANMKKITSL